MNMEPKEEDIITNADESKKLPDENPEPLTETKKDETEIKAPPKPENEERKENSGGKI